MTMKNRFGIFAKVQVSYINYIIPSTRSSTTNFGVVNQALPKKSIYLRNRLYYLITIENKLQRFAKFRAVLNTPTDQSQTVLNTVDTYLIRI